MPLFHFTLHAYRSWNADHPRGFVQRGKWGIKRPDRALAKARDRLASYPPVEFDLADRRFLVESVREAAGRRGRELYGVCATDSHVHFVAGWPNGSELSDDRVQTAMKRALGFLLAQQHGTTGRPYFSRGGLPSRVRDRRHLRWLLQSYFPRHGEARWCVKLPEKR